MSTEESSSRGQLRFYYISISANKDSAKRGRRERDRRRADAEIEVRGRRKDYAVLRIGNKTREGILLYLPVL